MKTIEEIQSKAKTELVNFYKEMNATRADTYPDHEQQCRWLSSKLDPINNNEIGYLDEELIEQLTNKSEELETMRLLEKLNDKVSLTYVPYSTLTS